MIVCIAEKPSVARDIARILGADRPHEGYIEGNGYQVTWTFGHLCELKNPDEYTPQWRQWSIVALPMIPQRFGIRLKEDQGVQKQFGIIERLMQAADSIINCGDAGQEGELIQRWVMQKAGAHCPVQRLWISSMTDEAIRDGFRHLRDQAEYESLYIAGLSRAIGDWLLGMNCTRLYTLKYAQNRQVLSIGRVQTPTLALIVRRQEEIEHFTPETYWVLSTIYRGTQFTAKQGKFTTHEDGEQALRGITDLPFTVTSVTSKKGAEAPPRLYDLTSLQVDCNKKFGYSADMTLRLIQSLYEKKVTTYPRVDTTFLTDDVYKQCPNILQGIRGYENYTAPLYGTRLPKRKKTFDNSKVTDHHAIIPTGQPAQGLTDMERNVYDLVTRAFIAAFYPDCHYLTTTVTGRSGKTDFQTSGKQITEPGWRTLYPRRDDNTKATGNDTTTADPTRNGEKDKERTLPAFTVGESGQHTPTLVERQTQPPDYYTEATLLRAMETAGKFVDNDELRDALKENGIGRPSTRAAIIETLFKRHYIRRDRKRIIATPTGIELIGIIHEELLKSAELTGIWEKKLREIEHKKYDARQFLDELKQMVIQIVQTVTTDPSNRRVTTTTDDDIKRAATTRRAPRKAKPVSSAPTPETSAHETPAPGNSAPTSASADSTQYVAGFRPRAAHSKSPATQPAATEGGTDEWIGLTCPLCGKGVIIKGHTAYGCSRWREGCTYRRPFD